MKNTLFPTFAALFLAIAIPLQRAASAADPATLPAGAASDADAAKVKSGAKAFLHALIDGNAAEAKKHVVSKPSIAATVDSLAGLMVAEKSFETAVTAKFGRGAFRRVLDNSPTPAEAVVAFDEAVNSGSAAVDGDNATINQAPHGKGPPELGLSFPMHMKLVDGSWRVDLPVPENQNAGDVTAMFGKLSVALAQTAKEITANKYATVNDVQKRLLEQMTAADDPAGDAPDTQPHKPEASK